jgi:hypothetical protein
MLGGGIFHFVHQLSKVGEGEYFTLCDNYLRLEKMISLFGIILTDKGDEVTTCKKYQRLEGMS